MVKKILVFTSTRADYGILYWLIHDLYQENSFDVKLLVSGTHLKKNFGLTYKEIERDGFTIDLKIPFISPSDTKNGIVRSMADAMLNYVDALNTMSPDLIILLGDRYEALAFAQSAYIMNIPILHLHGGELTQGAFDEGFRHCITKLSYFHCVACDGYRKRVIQLGENPNRVFNTGALGLEHIKRCKFKSKQELKEVFKFDFEKPYILITYHPETFQKMRSSEAIKIILDSLEEFKEFNLVMTYPNIDSGGNEIIDYLIRYSENNDRVLLVKSFGHDYYHSVVKYSQCVVGNSSSGLIEVPNLRVSSLNIGDRQGGRLCAKSVIHADLDKASIIYGVKKCIEITTRPPDNIFNNPYDSGKSTNMIIDIIKTNNIDLPKSFYDLEVML
ncbi:MAG: UDP-N-acetylglucosamine 2-epimerase (hydrolyzing) [Oceanospirillaceae bacterium]|nr:UDP-N-acetylglucosamine 2-epimerase (hydrolyzing) [Oceanospirillaceae bacterium]